MTRHQDGHQLSVLEFTDYVEDITKQFAQAADDLALPNLADALFDASAIAMQERARHMDRRTNN